MAQNYRIVPEILDPDMLPIGNAVLELEPMKSGAAKSGKRSFISDHWLFISITIVVTIIVCILLYMWMSRSSDDDDDEDDDDRNVTKKSRKPMPKAAPTKSEQALRDIDIGELDEYRKLRQQQKAQKTTDARMKQETSANFISVPPPEAPKQTVSFAPTTPSVQPKPIIRQPPQQPTAPPPTTTSTVARGEEHASEVHLAEVDSLLQTLQNQEQAEEAPLLASDLTQGSSQPESS
jgi:hypothetical protein